MNLWRLSQLAMAVLLWAPLPCAAQPAPAKVTDRVQRSMVKVYGAGGLQGLEAYQSGFLVSDQGHVVTADSLVLEQGDVTIVLTSGDRYSARVVGADPLLRVAVAQFDPAGESLDPVDLSAPGRPDPGAPLLAFSNMFNIATGNEDASVMRTHLAAKPVRQAAFGVGAPSGADRVLLVDSVTSNPGAAGGLLTDYAGRPVGMIGNEVQGRATGAWLNYAVPAQQVATSVQRILQGEQLRRAGQQDVPPCDPLATWGFSLVENIAVRTPPYVELVRSGSQAEAAGLKSDDLVVMVQNLITASVSESLRVLALRGSAAEVRLSVEREGRLVEVVLPGRDQQPLQEGTP